MTSERMYQVKLPSGSAGIIVKDNRVVHAAPTIRAWTIGETMAVVRHRVARRHGTIEPISTDKGDIQ